MEMKDTILLIIQGLIPVATFWLGYFIGKATGRLQEKFLILVEKLREENK